MKLLTGTLNGMGVASVFAVHDDRATVLAEGSGDLSALIAAVGDGKALLGPARGARVVDIADVTPTMPVSRPGKIICLGLNYAEHAREGGYELPDYPALFLRATSSMIPAEAPMVLPRCSTHFDYEAELMVIIGKGGRHIAEDNAFEHVFGYTTFNDGSVRDYQRKSHQWTAGKNFDATGAVGPVVVTPDEVPPGASGLAIRTRLNGRVLQDSSTADMIFPVAQTIAILSEVMTLEPGDLIAFGTPPGVGHARTPQIWMRPGDVVEVEIEGIGICRNPIQSEDDAAVQLAAAQ